MGEGQIGRKESFEDRRMWRLLLARAHPDAGGDHELFLFACALKDELGVGRRLDDGAADRAEPETDPSLRVWRSRMDSWASRNRDTLRSDHARRSAGGAHRWRSGDVF
jgi:hypothetical protein